MDQFNNLPLQQKLLVIVIVLGVIAFLGHYSLISPIEEEATQLTQQAKKVEGDLKKVRQQTASVAKKKDLDKRMKAAQDEQKALQQMLPTAEELETFIAGLSDLAYAESLERKAFELGDTRARDYYEELPIKMTVKATFAELISFLRKLRPKEGKGRVVNIRYLDITPDPLPIEEKIHKYTKQRIDQLKEGETLPKLSEAEQKLQLIQAYEESTSAGVELTVKFTAFVFRYTGQPADAESKEKNDADAVKKKEARQEWLLGRKS